MIETKHISPSKPHCQESCCHHHLYDINVDDSSEAATSSAEECEQEESH